MSTSLEARQQRLRGSSLLQAQLKEAIPLSIRQLARALVADPLFSYDEKSPRPLSKVMRDHLKGLADETEMEILFANGNRTSNKISNHPGLIEALNSPWELEFFDMDKSLYETNDLISKNSSSIPPLLYDLAKLDFAHRPLSQIAIEKLMADGEKIPEALRYLKKDYHPLFMRMRSEAKRCVLKKSWRTSSSHAITLAYAFS